MTPLSCDETTSTAIEAIRVASFEHPAADSTTEWRDRIAAVLDDYDKARAKERNFRGKGLSYQGRETEWLVGRIRSGAAEVRMEYRPASEDWWVWAPNHPEIGFVAQGNYQDVGRLAHRTSDDLAEAERSRRRAEVALDRARKVDR